MNKAHVIVKLFFDPCIFDSCLIIVFFVSFSLIVYFCAFCFSILSHEYNFIFIACYLLFIKIFSI